MTVSFSARQRIVALTLLGVMTACTRSPDIVRPGGGTLLRTYISLGNSITAGYQAGGINDSTQKQAYPGLIAQAAGARFALPLIPRPGCPGPIANVITGERVGGPDAPACTLRDAASATSLINDVAVPGATSFDPAVPFSTASNIYTQLILGGKSQARRAVDAKPTFVSAWIGNNDVLLPALSGILAATPGISPGVTSLDDFTSNYQQLMDTLALATSIRGGALIGVIDVTQAPIFFPAALLVPTSGVFSPAAAGAFNAATGCTTDSCPGGPVMIHPSCGPTTTTLVSFQLAAAIASFRVDPEAPTSHPPLLVCEKNQTNIPPPVGDLYILDAGEQTALRDTVAAYNAFIASKATENDWIYFDPNPLLAALRAGGAIPIFPDLAHPTAAFGNFVSNDGIHPAAAAHLAIADSLMTRINATYGTSYPLP